PAVGRRRRTHRLGRPLRPFRSRLGAAAGDGSATASLAARRSRAGGVARTAGPQPLERDAQPADPEWSGGTHRGRLSRLAGGGDAPHSALRLVPLAARAGAGRTDGDAAADPGAGGPHLRGRAACPRARPRQPGGEARMSRFLAVWVPELPWQAVAGGGAAHPQLVVECGAPARVVVAVNSHT